MPRSSIPLLACAVVLVTACKRPVERKNEPSRVVTPLGTELARFDRLGAGPGRYEPRLVARLAGAPPIAREATFVVGSGEHPPGVQSYAAPRGNLAEKPAEIAFQWEVREDRIYAKRMMTMARMTLAGGACSVRGSLRPDADGREAVVELAYDCASGHRGDIELRLRDTGLGVERKPDPLPPLGPVAIGVDPTAKTVIDRRELETLVGLLRADPALRICLFAPSDDAAKQLDVVRTALGQKGIEDTRIPATGKRSRASSGGERDGEAILVLPFEDGRCDHLGR